MKAWPGKVDCLFVHHLAAAGAQAAGGGSEGEFIITCGYLLQFHSLF